MLLHKTLEAQATITELGEFTAIAAAYSVDRANERILPGAFKASIERWQGSGKQIPLHWDHMGDAKNIIGSVDPASMRETDEGLEVKGQLDLEDSEVAREAWRSMKKNSIGLSFGYLVTADGKAEDGIRELKAVDVFEVSITPAPMNPDTRFIDMKSASVAVKRELAREFVAEVKELKGEVQEREDLLQDALENREEKRAVEVEAQAVTQMRRDAEDIEYAVATRGLNTEERKQEKPQAKPEEPPSEPGEAAKDVSDKGEQVWEKWAGEHIVEEPEGSTNPAKATVTVTGANILHENGTASTVSFTDPPEVPAEKSEVKCCETCGHELTVEQAKAIEDARDEEPIQAKSEAQDPLRTRYDEIALELSTRGIAPSEPPEVEEKSEEPPSMETLRRDYYDLMLELQT